MLMMVIHTQPSPFPFTTPNGQTVLDELCRCGALRSLHQDTFAFGHGGYPMTACAQFTWESSVFPLQQPLNRRDTAKCCGRSIGACRVMPCLGTQGFRDESELARNDTVTEIVRVREPNQQRKVYLVVGPSRAIGKVRLATWSHVSKSWSQPKAWRADILCVAPPDWPQTKAVQRWLQQQRDAGRRGY